MFVDASALCAILLDEPDADYFTAKLETAVRPITSAVAVYETVAALLRAKTADPAEARAQVEEFMRRARMETVPIGGVERDGALGAMARFGKGHHPARLNMGDCFAYACAKSRGVPLLYKGEDFAMTDIVAA